jgi:hypothetical protein
MTLHKLTEEQCWSLASYLRTAAGKFAEFAAQDTVLSAQFEKQRLEANAMATLFENAESARVEVA